MKYIVIKTVNLGYRWKSTVYSNGPFQWSFDDNDATIFHDISSAYAVLSDNEFYSELDIIYCVELYRGNKP